MSLGVLVDEIAAVGVLWSAAEAIAKGPFRQDDPAHQAGVSALHRPHQEAEVRAATYLGTDLESPHMFHMTPPPDRPLEDKHNDRA